MRGGTAALEPIFALSLSILGFTAEGNPNDALMVSCPLPPVAEWDEVMHARMELLASRELAPQFFLPAALLEPEQQGGTGSR
jgi:hypothetical protein